ncbi:MAG: site-2 protease family protein [Actinomycetes bacterium]
MLFALGVLLLLAFIALSIGLHEVGHLLPAKHFGVKVTQYMVGFGPTIWSREGGETEYGLKAVPLGGYIRMIGMYPPAADGTVRASSTGRMSALIDEARKANAEEIGLHDDSRTFYRLTVPRKLAVMLGGPVMNLVLATIFFTLLVVGVGLPTLTATASAVVPCTPTASNLTGGADAAGLCVGSPASPAAAAGLKVGDTITSVGGAPISTWDDVSAAIAAAGAGPTTIVVNRDGVTSTLNATLITVPRPVITDSGKPTGEIQQKPFLGVGPTTQFIPQSITAVPGQMWDITTRSVSALVTLPVRMYELTGTLISGGERDPESPVSVVGVTRLGGEALSIDEPWRTKAALILSLVAGLNLFLFLFNLLPILPLDGGHVAGALYEGGRRRIAKMRGRPDPGPVDLTKALPLAYGVSIALIVVSAVVIYADIFKPITFGG